VSREYASPLLANLIASRLSPEEFERRTTAPLTDGEADEIAELIGWFSRRYPTAKERLAYARGKMRQYARGGAPAAVSRDYLDAARSLARAHRAADPRTQAVLLDPDPDRKEIRLLEVTGAAPRAAQLDAVGFAARPDLGIPFTLTLLLLNPEDWAAVTAAQLALPAPWSVERLQAL
jgi:hypothetical protein